MPRFLLAVAVVLAAVAPARAQQPAASPSSPTLDYDFFKARVQPMFTTKRDGNARCVSCHGFGTTMRLQGCRPAPRPGAKRTRARTSRSSNRGSLPENLRSAGCCCIRWPKAPAATTHHDGGKHWTSKDDPEWQTLAAWVKGDTLRARRRRTRKGPHHPDQQRR